MIKTILPIVQLVISVLLVAAVLVQQKGAGLGGVFGGSSNVYSAKRGFDKIVFRATIVLAVLFFLVALASLLLV